MRFRAEAVAAVRDDELNTAYMVLSEHQDGSGRRLEVQRALQPTDQDVALGHDTYCLVTDSGATHYGGVVAWQIDNSTLTMRLDDSAAQALGAAEFCIELSDRDRPAVEEAMRRLVA